ncbi:MAG TPA: glycoside hydrolase family 2 protein, partial [Bacteroidia bacterium]|nr:glycoside hydrolase family 2 protein [Bacteroidia bacterium]
LPPGGTLSDVRFVFPVVHPRLWWCTGYGKQELYDFTLTLKCGKDISAQTTRTGLRTIELTTNTVEYDGQMAFILNGKKIYMRGANWIPCDNFLPRVTTEKYYSLLKNAKDCGMNMLRVWGGGVYEDDRFYNICDSLGIMVWQDFMFAGGVYPASVHFMDIAGKECMDQTERLAGHPCVSLFCGNNEIAEGWMNWGWQKEMNYSKADSLALVAEMLQLDNGIRLVMKTNAANIPYWPSSPSTGWGHKEAFEQGDVHYWGVWWGMEPFSAYDDHIGRFMSEFGFQGMPDMRTFFDFTGRKALSLNDADVISHEKHPKGFETINTYMARDYPVPSSFDDYVYVSQVMQADGVTRAIEAQRHTRPYCMGSLFWQYNDCWPVTSWSSVDYYGRPKLLQYRLKEAYAPVMMDVLQKDDTAYVYIVNDDTLLHTGVLGFRWMNMAGNNERYGINPFRVPAEHSRLALILPFKLLEDSVDRTKGFLELVFNYENGKVLKKTVCLTSDRNMQFVKDPGISFDVSQDPDRKNEFTVSLRAVSYAKDVFLSLDDPSATFSDNGFDLIPSEETDVKITTSLNEDELKRSLVIKSMNQVK